MKEKILIVDDAGFMRMMVKDILEKNGFEVVAAVDGFDGIEKFKEHSPALTLMDITMPGINGIKTAEKIKEIDGGAKIVMLSACTFPEQVAESFIAGAVDFVSKPFSADRLINVVGKHLKADTKLDIDEIKLWKTEYNQIRNINIDEQKLMEKLIESITSCIEPSSDVDISPILPELVSRIKQHIGLEKQKLTQADIDSLLDRVVKG